MINNEFYNDLGDDWLHRLDHPVALLRAENAVRTPWVLKELEAQANVLDVGCGAGLLANAIAKAGHEVTGVDISASSLRVARKNDETKRAVYLEANAYSLPFPDASFDAVCAMDVLEHVEEPKRLIAEASRVLKKGGLFFFHTFNRNLWSYLLVIKGVDWFVPNAPPNMHVYPLFIKPRELNQWLEGHQLLALEWLGLQPSLRSICTLLRTRTVPKDFVFRFCKSLKTGYCGKAKKEPI